MKQHLFLLGGHVASLPVAIACGVDGDCYGPLNTVQHVRQIRREQPGVPSAVYGPSNPLEWGQLNFIHTTDTHGWLEGHIKEQNYGADWGDFVTFTRRMKQMAGNRGVDMLLIDTGDLHDGTGLSDATTVDGEKSMPIFNEIDFDLLTIGNHELYVSEVTQQIFREYASKWGERYLTSNVQIFNNKTGEFEYIGATHRYFTTKKGLRIMAFGVLFNFGGNSNISRIIKATDMVQEKWFTDAIHTNKPVDLFLLIGHNPARRTATSSTLGTVWDAIRAVHKHTPIQIFGGHSHIRDFAVYDNSSVAIESGRYCETFGWVSMSGFDASNSGYHGVRNPHGVPNPCRKATPHSNSPFVYSRRYLDWNRKTMIYHTNDNSKTYDYHSGERVTGKITKVRQDLKLGQVYGCTPQTYCMDCVPFDNKSNIFPGVVEPAVTTVVVNQTRKSKSRVYLGNTGGIRFDLHKGPFTLDDSFIVSPFRNVFLYIPDVPYAKAKNLLKQLNVGPADKRDNLVSMPALTDSCINPTLGFMSSHELRGEKGVVRRQETLVPGYVTKDDFGTDGDDTKHIAIPEYSIPSYWGANGNFPSNKKDPDTVDVIFIDFIEALILQYLGSGYSKADVSCYIDCNFTSQDFLLPYAKKVWQKNVDNCPL